MRTTLTLDDDIASRLQTEARRSGRLFKVVVNECLRAGLAQRRALKAASPFRVEPRNIGGPLPGVSYDNVGALRDETEGPGRR